MCTRDDKNDFAAASYRVTVVCMKCLYYVAAGAVHADSHADEAASLHTSDTIM